MLFLIIVEWAITWPVGRACGQSLWALQLTNSNEVTCLPRKTWHNDVASLNAANVQVHMVLCWASHV